MRILNINTSYINKINFKAQKNKNNTSYKNSTPEINTTNFEELVHQKASTIEEAKKFAFKNFHIINFNVKDVSSANSINNALTRVYNTSKGKAHFPPIITVEPTTKGRYSGYCTANEVSIINIPSKIQDLFHELGHFNHMFTTKHYYEMGKYSELIEDGVKDFSIFNKFQKDKKNLKLIKKYLTGYATSSPAEFIACTFNALMNNKNLPEEIYTLYKNYEGPFADIFLQRIKK